MTMILVGIIGSFIGSALDNSFGGAILFQWFLEMDASYIYSGQSARIRLISIIWKHEGKKNGKFKIEKKLP